MKPKYALISAGTQAERGDEQDLLPPEVVDGRGTDGRAWRRGLAGVRAFDAKASCKKSEASHWVDVPASDRLWATERDGDVVLTTNGNGEFARE